MSEKTIIARVSEKTLKRKEKMNMADENKDLEALKAELERLKSENEKLMNAQSNAAADASKYKKELQARMTEQEKAAEETKELIAGLKAENARMKREQEIAVRTAAFAGLGFDADLAKQAAETYGTDHDSFVGSLKSFLTAHDKALLAEQMRATPRPSAGGTDKAITKEQFAKMSYSERAKLYDEQPDLYQELIK